MNGFRMTIINIRFGAAQEQDKSVEMRRASRMSQKISNTCREMDCVFGSCAMQDNATGEHFVALFVDCRKPLPTNVPEIVGGVPVRMRTMNLTA